MLVIPVSFLHAGGGATVALVTRGAAEFFGIVNLQQFGLRMARKCARVFIRLLRALFFHGRSRNLERLAGVHVARFATIDDVSFGDVDLHDRRIPFGGAFLQAIDLLWREIDEVIGNIGVDLCLGVSDRLEYVAEFEAELGLFVANTVVRFFELRKGELLPAAIGEDDRGLPRLVGVDFLLLAGFG